MTRAQTSSGKWNAATASAISRVVAVVDATSPPTPSRVRAASSRRPASAASSMTVSSVAGASIRAHVSARVSEPAWNSDRSRSVFTSSGGGSMIRSNP